MLEEAYFQMHLWRPLTSERYTQEFSKLVLTVPDGTELKTMCETLRDGRLRATTYAEVMILNPTHTEPGRSPDEEPYLMVIHDRSDGKAHCFVRTDVGPAWLES